MKLWLTVAYDGRNFCGWQAQDNGRSVQRTLSDTCTRVYGRRCLVTGCSRTDSGVHARAYSCTVTGADAGGADITEIIPVDAVPRALNANLPEDIAVLAARRAPDDFHPRYDVKYKTYEYVFYDSPTRSPFLSGTAHHVRRITEEALARMDEAARAMCGRRDFAAFMASGSKITDTVRTVTDCTVHREGIYVIFRVTADGFLYKMVRTMAGTALAAAEGRLTAADVDGIIESRERKRAGATLPPDGLYLCEVVY